MKLTSPAFSEGGKIPSKYTCEGEEINPPLDISGVPSQAKTLALLLDDPDVPAYVRKDQMWDHWVLFNIPPTTTTIPEHAKALGTHGRNTSGSFVYQGPCPPDREHRYFFKLYALDTPLHLPEGASKADVEKAIVGHVLASTQLMGKYEKHHP